MSEINDWLEQEADRFSSCLEKKDWAGAQEVIDLLKENNLDETVEELEKELQAARANHTEE